MSTKGVIGSEWLKIRSLRSTLGSLIAIFVVTAGLSALVCALLDESDIAKVGPDPLAVSFYGLAFGQVAAISFGFANAPLRMEDRFDNPLGFQVTRYRRDTEGLPR